MQDEAAATASSGSSENGFAPPYASFRTLINLVERMASEGGTPSRIDRSYLSNMPGSSQTMLLSSLKSLGMTDSQGHPTDLLNRVVAETDGRPTLVAGVLRAKYAAPLALAPNATQAQLEEKFRDYGVSGSTLRKAIAFFLAAASYADVSVSPHFRTPKAAPSSNGVRPPRAAQGGRGKGQNAPAPPPLAHEPSDPKSRYIDLLLKKAESDPTDELFDRIEKVLGLNAAQTSAQTPGQGAHSTAGGESDS